MAHKKLGKATRKAIAAVQVARKESFLKPLRAQLYRAAAVHFQKQGDALLGELRRRGHVLNESVCMEGLGDDIDSILSDIFAEYRGGFQTAMASTLQRAMHGGVEHRLADFGTHVSFDLANPGAQQALKDYCGQMIAGIDETTRRSVKQTIISGESAGKSYSEIARSLVEKFDSFGTPAPQAHLQNRGETIAVQELGRAYETAGRQTVDALAQKGLPMEKSWSTAGDDRVSEECAANEGEGWIPLADAFSDGSQEPPGHVACRCAALYQLAMEQAQAQLAG